MELKNEERTKCEIWTRVMGYLRPKDAANPGKQGEFAERKLYRMPADIDNTGDLNKPEWEV